MKKVKICFDAIDDNCTFTVNLPDLPRINDLVNFSQTSDSFLEFLNKVDNTEEYQIRFNHVKYDYGYDFSDYQTVSHIVFEEDSEYIYVILIQ